MSAAFRSKVFMIKLSIKLGCIRKDNDIFFQTHKNSTVHHFIQ